MHSTHSPLVTPGSRRLAEHPGDEGELAFQHDYVNLWAQERPNATAVRFIDFFADRKGVESTIDFATLDRWTRALAARIQSLTAPGDRVALLTPQSAEYVIAFTACLRTQVVNVPLYAPDMPGQGSRLESVVADCRPNLVLTTRDKRELVEAFVAEHLGLGPERVLCIEDDAQAPQEQVDAYVWPEAMQLDDVAYLQYTSGSTRTPAGVVLSHRNLVVNVLQLINGHGLTWDQAPTTVSWLPLFHDMGLLLGAAGPVLGGAESVLLDPVAFVLKPLRWLQACSGRQQVVTAAPNFAYDYVAKRVKDAAKADLDLAGVVGWANGAEPVLPATLDRFAEAFAECGVERKSLRPTYGLAEVTVLVSVTPPGEEPTIIDVDAAALQQGLAKTDLAEGSRSVQLVASGKAAWQHVVIADPETGARLPEGTVGEIWVHGANVGQGYWQKPEETAALFGAELSDPGDLPASGWLRTEDLGALIDERLFVTGRIKDLIIVDGRNIYPHDIEFTVEEAHGSIAQRRLAAFSVDVEGGEALVVVAERYKGADDAGSELDAIARAAAQAVSEQHAVALHELVLVEPDTVKRTSSGKIARKATRTDYLDGTLSRVAPAPADQGTT